jgi:hypothetical protein
MVAHNHQYKPDEMRFVKLKKKKIEMVMKDVGKIEIRENIEIANIVHFVHLWFVEGS